MTYRGHALGGVAAAGLVYPLAPTTGAPLCLAILVAVFAALVPDLDHPRAYLSRRLAPVREIALLVLCNPLTWALAGRGRAEASVLEPPGRRRPVRLWLYSRSVIRLAIGRERQARHVQRCGGSHAPVPLVLRCFWNPASRALLGRGRSLRLYHHMREGRDRMRHLARHRGISHTWAAALACTLVFLPVAIMLARGVRFVGLPVEVGGALAAYSVGASLPVLLSLSFAAGYLSHIILDSMTKTGTRPNWPVSEATFHLLPESLRVTTR